MVSEKTKRKKKGPESGKGKKVKRDKKRSERDQEFLRLAPASSGLTGSTIADAAGRTPQPSRTVVVIECGRLRLDVGLGEASADGVGISQVTLSASDPTDPALTANDLAGIRWHELLRLADAAASIPVQSIEVQSVKVQSVQVLGPRVVRPTVAQEGTTEGAGVTAEQDRRAGTANGAAPEDAELRHVARVYVSAVGDRHRSPVRLVAQELQLSLSTAGRRVEAARRAGFIPDDTWAKKRQADR